jgi:hypothetical protein
MSTPYDFNKREETEYSHSFDYLGGVGLGKAEAHASRERELKRGKYDMVPVDPPTDITLRDEIIKIAQMLHASPQKEALILKIEQARDKRMEFVWNKKHVNHPFFEWATHCVDREVPNWTSIRHSSENSQKTASTERPTQTPIKLGEWVEISDVQARPELNGKRGIVRTVNPNGRLEVDFPDIAQIVSLALNKCSKSSLVGAKPVGDNRLPSGLKVEVANLTSEQGKLLNGLKGYIMEFNEETDRYTVRLDVSIKSLKSENLHVCLPPGWEEHVDPSSGEKFFRNLETRKVSWEHPILGGKKRKIATTFVEEEFVNHEPESENEHEKDEEFDRSEFLVDERKRLRLDKKRTGIKEDTVRKLLNLVRHEFGLSEPSLGAPLFEGTPAALLERLNTRSPKDLVIGLELVFQDLSKLKFNKRQIAGFAEHLDQILEEKPFSDEMIDWLEGALKIAMPVSYTIV